MKFSENERLTLWAEKTSYAVAIDSPTSDHIILVSALTTDLSKAEKLKQKILSEAMALRDCFIVEIKVNVEKLDEK